jgi:arsenite-transporting ATPase
MSRAVFFLGKGGVGKTTCALALARARSARLPVVAASLDPAHNLADLARSGPPPGELSIHEPDLDAMARARARRSVDAIRSGYRSLDVLGLGGLAGLVEHAPGIQEQSAIDALVSLDAGLPPGGLLVVDMPPTGLALRTLALPSLVLGWIASLTGLRRRILERRGAIAHVRGEGAPAGEASDEVMQVLARESAAALGARALIASALHVIVVNPEPLGIAEAGRIQAMLRTAGADDQRLVVNRAAAVPATLPDGLRGLGATLLPDRADRARDAAVLDELGAILDGALP